jgi:hypothetical protein
MAWVFKHYLYSRNKANYGLRNEVSLKPEIGTTRREDPKIRNEKGKREGQLWANMKANKGLNELGSLKLNCTMHKA